MQLISLVTSECVPLVYINLSGQYCQHTVEILETCQNVIDS